MSARHVQIRLATPADAPRIAQMSRDLIEVGLGWTWRMERVLRHMRARDTISLVAATPQRVIGFALAQFGDTHAHVNLFAVHLDWQRRGIGRRMMVWVEESALTAGITAIHLEFRAANHTARRFYDAQGYVEIARLPGYYRGLEAAIRMARDIRRAPAGADEVTADNVRRLLDSLR